MSDEPKKDQDSQDSKIKQDVKKEEKKPVKTEEKPKVKKGEKKEKAEKSKAVKRDIPDNIKAGQKVKVHQRIFEGKKDRIQVFEGTILGLRGATPATKTITVRKISEGVEVEKIFPLALPTIEKIEIISEIRTRRSKLYYLRDYKKKLKEKKV